MNRYIHYFLLYNYSLENEHGYLNYILLFRMIKTKLLHLQCRDLKKTCYKINKIRDSKNHPLFNDVMRQYVSSMMSKHAPWLFE